jgi:hypothetical protein
VNAPINAEADAQHIRQLSNEELLDRWRRAEVESALADLIADEMEKRNLDD